MQPTDKLKKLYSGKCAIFKISRKLKLISGHLLKQIIENTQKQLDTLSGNPKMYLYATHDVTIVGLLSALGIFEPHYPAYMACVIMEVHKIEERYEMRVYKSNISQI